MSEEMTDILGYGKKVKVMVGNKDDKEYIQEFHFTPVSLRDLPELQEKLEEFFTVMEGKTIGDEKALKVAAEIIGMSMKKMHSDIKADQILDMFSLGAIGKIISIVMDVNDFLAEMGKIQEAAEKFKPVVPMT